MILKRLKHLLRRIKRSCVLVVCPDHEIAQNMLKRMNDDHEPVGYYVNGKTLEVGVVISDTEGEPCTAVLIDETTPHEEVDHALNYEGNQTIITTDLALIDYPAAYHSFSMMIACCDCNHRRFARFGCIVVNLNGKS